MENKEEEKDSKERWYMLMRLGERPRRPTSRPIVQFQKEDKFGRGEKRHDCNHPL